LVEFTVISGLLSKALAEEASATKLEGVLASEAPDTPRADLTDLAELLEHYLNGVPSALDALTAMTKEQQVGRSVAFAAGQVLVYLVDEDDLFPDEELGALGLLDDAYLIHGCVAALRLTFPGLSVPSGYVAPDERSLAAVRTLLPPGIPEALDRTCENLVRVAAALYSGGRQRSSTPPSPRPTLRVGDAVASLR
jgi:uncharacterized membrane protein YkvA (DUF1232 family)